MSIGNRNAELKRAYISTGLTIFVVLGAIAEFLALRTSHFLNAALWLLIACWCVSRAKRRRIVAGFFILVLFCGVGELIVLRSFNVIDAGGLALQLGIAFWAVRLILHLRKPSARANAASVTELPVNCAARNAYYRLVVSHPSTAETRIEVESLPSWRRVLMGVCPMGMLVVMPLAVAWAIVVEPPSHWAFYPPLALFMAFVAWLGVVWVLGMNLRQCFWGLTRLELSNGRLSHRVVWLGVTWLEACYRTTPATTVVHDGWTCNEIVLFGLEADPPKPLRKRIGPMISNATFDFAGGLMPSDAELVAAYLRQQLQTRPMVYSYAI